MTSKPIITATIYVVNPLALQVGQRCYITGVLLLLRIILHRQVAYVVVTRRCGSDSEH